MVVQLLRHLEHTASAVILGSGGNLTASSGGGGPQGKGLDQLERNSLKSVALRASCDEAVKVPQVARWVGATSGHAWARWPGGWVSQVAMHGPGGWVPKVAMHGQVGGECVWWEGRGPGRAGVTQETTVVVSQVTLVTLTP